LTGKRALALFKACLQDTPQTAHYHNECNAVDTKELIRDYPRILVTYQPTFVEQNE
jgi:hypothetical protein